ncbi:MAG: type I-U CRISPR-associated helicase/endonuclease Cas3 [Acidobacteria bacterium]|nr:type I-U CRISPR-associated helicase/endonuclease Cas3 [Acidobacteriota bacterium]
MSGFPTLDEFFKACWDADPYPWQRELAKQVQKTGSWPALLDLPTGSGKTAAIDIALYTLAHRAVTGQARRSARRIFLVADRRALVDQAWKRAQHLLDQVNTHGALQPIRKALASLSDEPARAVRLRGACPTDRPWYNAADQVLIVASTVDQIGSRVLMRGYGTSPRTRPIEAGLAACDSLWLIDEAHLARPLLDTLATLRELEPVRHLGNGFKTVLMSATPQTTRTNGYTVTVKEADRRHKELGRRLRAARTVSWSEGDPAALAANCTETCLLMVANTVATARAWYRKIDRSGTKRPSTEKRFLITGRMRPIERAALVEEIDERLEQRLPMTVVATQCVEAGLDWDFDALISECASWDALTQRVGRVNRRGRCTQATCRIVEARRVSQRNADGERDEPACPVYGRHERAVAEWLQDVGSAEWTPESIPRFNDDRVLNPEHAPLLLPEYLTLWSQTRASGPAYNVAAFLHGRDAAHDVSIIWRDIREDDTHETRARLIENLPPSSLEAVRIPIGRARRWLGARKATRVGPRTEQIDGTEIKPDDTIVVPESYGGLRDGTFDEGCTHGVTNVTAAALMEHRNIDYELIDRPEEVDEEEPTAEQVANWCAKEPARHRLRKWKWVDAGRRWLFVSRRVGIGDDAPMHRNPRTTLADHVAEAVKRTARTAERLLVEEFHEDFTLTAGGHDLGKLDARMQRMLGRGDDEPPLAHSGDRPDESRRIHDYPDGERHEGLSVELMRRLGVHCHRDENSRELIEHLVASHHGWARPFIQPAQGTAMLVETLGSAVGARVTHDEAARAPARFARLQERYGWLGLAWLEAVFRLADQSATAAGTMHGVDTGKWTAGLRKQAKPTVAANRWPKHVVEIPTLAGNTPGDYLAAIGVLHALSLRHPDSRLGWRGTTPVIHGNVGEEEIAGYVAEVRGEFSVDWPNDLNRLPEGDICRLLATTQQQPSRSLVTAMLSAAGASRMDFVSSGRGGFRNIATGMTSTTDGAARKLLSAERLNQTLFGRRSLHRHAGRSAVSGSFRWAPLATQEARRPRSETDDVRTEPWIECLSLMGVAAFTTVPRPGRKWLPASTGMPDGCTFQWPLWEKPLDWDGVRQAVGATPASLPDAGWYTARRFSGRTKGPRTYQFSASRVVPTNRRRRTRALQ